MVIHQEGFDAYYAWNPIIPVVIIFAHKLHTWLLVPVIERILVLARLEAPPPSSIMYLLATRDSASVRSGEYYQLCRLNSHLPRLAITKKIGTIMYSLLLIQMFQARHNITTDSC
jgi:hypothetical protein